MKRKYRKIKNKDKFSMDSVEFWSALYPNVFNFSPGSVRMMEAAINLDTEKLKGGRKKVRARRWEGNRGKILKKLVQQ